ncbi:SagB/ThcOx family dehydrogenase [Pseudodesulfovibrio sp.]|nr:SagB/ThcOx family dehydrogenase [Pseudodesulfovibrio sp.]
MAKKTYTILDYHRDTAHIRGAISGRTLDRSDVPHPFKVYRGVPTFHLAHDLALPDVPLDKALTKRPLPEKASMPHILAGICNLTAGISQVRNSSEDTVFHFRTVASAGGLYPAELYMALQKVNGMNDGLYHYSPLQHTLSHLRSGYVFGALSGTKPIIRFFLTAIHHRSAWKYGPRAYRYCLLDAGHMAENLRLAARIHGLPATLDYDFNDAFLARFLGIDEAYEGCLVQVHSLGCKPDTEMDEEVPLTSEDIPIFSRCAAKAVAPEALAAVNRITATFARCPVKSPTQSSEKTTPLPDPIVPASTPATIMSRRSRRNFVPRTAPTRDLVDIIGMVCRDVAPACSSGLEVGFIASEQSGLKPGYHRINRGDCSTTLIKPGDLMPMAARASLDQGWLENAAIHFVFTANLDALNQQCGPRAYRYAHLEAGRLGQRIYLSATAKQLGACGIGAFFDQEAASLFSLPQGHALLYLVAVGPIRK